MRAIGASVFLICLLGCGRDTGADNRHSGSGDESKNQAPKPSTKLPSNEVAIDENAQEKAGIVVEQVRLSTSPEYLNAVGQTFVNDEKTAHLGAYTDGRVVQVMANVGDQVKRGAVLARMHSHDVHETRAAYETAKQGVARQQNTVEYQRRLRDRMERLYQLKSASRLEVDKAESDLRAAENDLASAQIAVVKEVAHLTDILHIPESEIANLNEETEEVPVVASIGGTVGERKINTGSVVEPGDEVFVLSNLSSLWLIASVSEMDIAKVHLGDEVRLLTKAFPDEDFSGRVTRISNELDPRSRVLPVRVLVPNPTRKLKTAMYVDARIVQSGSRPRILLSENAIQDINGGSVVFVRKQNDLFEARPIEIHQRLHGQAEISSGLKAGEAVVTKGSFVVKSQMLKNQIGE